MRFARVLFIVVLLLCGLDTVRLWFMSPEVMAAHFNLQGNPDRFVPRFDFFAYQVQTVLVVIAVSLMLQVLPLVLPVQWINMHNREYWLSPENRTATLYRLSSFGAALSAAILLAVQAGFELAMSANLHAPIAFAAQIMISIIAGFFILSLVMLFLLARSFHLPS